LSTCSMMIEPLLLLLLCVSFRFHLLGCCDWCRV
jgi:hypothetical protein